MARKGLTAEEKTMFTTFTGVATVVAMTTLALGSLTTSATAQ